MSNIIRWKEDLVEVFLHNFFSELYLLKSNFSFPGKISFFYISARKREHLWCAFLCNCNLGATIRNFVQNAFYKGNLQQAQNFFQTHTHS